MRSLEEERRRFGLLIISTVIVALGITFLPSLYFYKLHDWLLIDVIIIAATLLFAFQLIVVPFTLKKEYLAILIYDLEKEHFLEVGEEPNYVCHANTILSDSSLKDEMKKLFNKDTSPPKIEEVKKLIELLLQATLLGWIDSLQFSGVPVSRFISMITTPLPTKYLRRPLQSFQAIETEEISLECTNPYLKQTSLPYSRRIRLPKGTKINLSQNNIKLIHKRFEIEIEPEFICFSVFPSSLTRPYFQKLAYLFKLLKILVKDKDLGKSSY